MLKLKNKRAQDLLTGTVMFIVLNVAFFGLMLLFVTNVGTNAATLEKIYSRQIALTIDNMRPGTETTLYLPKLFDAAEKNKFTQEVVDLSVLEEGKITVRVAKGDGNSFYYFTKPLGSGSLIINSNDKTITIKT